MNILFLLLVAYIVFIVTIINNIAVNVASLLNLTVIDCIHSNIVIDFDVFVILRATDGCHHTIITVNANI